MSLGVHLYRRGSVYWWRRVLPACGAAVGDGGAPKNFSKKIAGREIRLSLRTNMPGLARQRGRRLSVVVDAVLALLGEVMQAGTIDTSALRALLQPILLGALERAEVARAPSGKRGSEEIARRIQAKLDTVGQPGLRNGGSARHGCRTDGSNANKHVCPTSPPNIPALTAVHSETDPAG